MNQSKPERIKYLLRSFVDCVIWRGDKGGGTLEIELFPVPFVRPGEATLKKMLSEVAAKCGSGTLLFRPGVADGVPDGI